jgi:hypothetical protein
MTRAGDDRRALCLFPKFSYAVALLSLLLLRAALFGWMRPLRAARSSSFVAVALVSALASGAFAFLSAVRKAERCARLRTVAARDLRMFFFADAIFGTKEISKKCVAVAGFAKAGT